MYNAYSRESNVNVNYFERKYLQGKREDNELNIIKSGYEFDRKSMIDCEDKII